MRMGASRDEASRRLERRKIEERGMWVQSIVTALWEELAAGNKDGHVLADPVFQHREKSIIDGCIPHTTPIISHDVETTVAPEATMSAVIPVETPVLETSEARGWNEELERLRWMRLSRG